MGREGGREGRMGWMDGMGWDIYVGRFEARGVGERLREMKIGEEEEKGLEGKGGTGLIPFEMNMYRVKVLA